MVDRKYSVLVLVSVAVLAAGCTVGTGAGAQPAELLDGSVPASGSATMTQTAPASVSPAPQVTPVLATVAEEPAPVATTDATVTLVYELSLLNATSAPVTLTAVRALDAGTGEVIEELSGARLPASFRATGARPGGGADEQAVLDPGQHGFIWLSPEFGPTQSVPESVEHEIDISFSSPPDPSLAARSTETVAPTEVRQRGSVVIGPPLRGRNWLVERGCCDVVNSHRTMVNPIDGRYFFAGRFATDWVQLDDQQRLAVGDPASPGSYFSWGEPVIAVMDGTIAEVHDAPPTPPSGDSSPADPWANQVDGPYLVQEFEQDGRTYYALYANLEAGSTAAWQVGRPVKKGEVIGKLGDAGNSGVPHLRFQIMNGPDPLASDPVPYEFNTLDLVGRARPEKAIDATGAGRSIPLTPAEVPGARTNTLPLAMDVVDFPSEPSAAGPSR